LIYHAVRAPPAPALPLTVAMILEDLGILPIATIRCPPLLPPRLLPARFTAVGLAPVTRPADEKHLATLGRTAKQLSKLNRVRHCSHCSRAEWTMAATRGKLDPMLVGSALRYESRHQETPTVSAVGVFLLSAVTLTLTSLCFGDDDQSNKPACVLKTCGFKCVPTCEMGIGCKRGTFILRKWGAMIPGKNNRQNFNGVNLST
jgi:hypothetical protein